MKGIGRALAGAGKTNEAVRAFELVLKLSPDTASSEEDLGIAFSRAGQLEDAASHLERAVQLDPLLLSAGTALQEVYRSQGAVEKAEALAQRMRRTMLSLP